MKSGKPKTKRYQFGGTLRSQISGTRNAPPPKRPAPAPAKPVPVTPPGGQVQDKINTKPPLDIGKGTGAMPPQVKEGAVSPVPPPPRSTIAPTPTAAKTTFSNPAVAGGVFNAFQKAGVSPAEVEGYTKAALQQGKSAGLGAMPATPTKTTGGPFNSSAGTVYIPQSSPRAPTGGLSGMLAALKNLNTQTPAPKMGMKKGGSVKAYAKGGKVSSASSRGDGIAQRGKTRGKMV